MKPKREPKIGKTKVQNPKTDPNGRDRRSSSPSWILLAGLCIVFLVGAIAFFGMKGVPGTTGGTSESQQQTSGAPQPQNDINTGRTRETTGYRPGPTNN